jgi:O-antigen ligase
LKIALPPLELARWLLAAVMVALLFSPPLTSVLELLLYALMLASPQLRSRLARTVRQPLAFLALGFWAVVAFGVVYSSAPSGDSVGILVSWRRILLLVVGLALFDDVAWKRRVAFVLVATAACCAIASFGSAFFDVSFRHFAPGVILRQHALQGMVFSVAAFSAALLSRHSILPRMARLALGTSALLLVANVVFITPGRSGYVVLAILGVASVLSLLKERGATRLERLAWTTGAALLVVALMSSSPIVRQRVDLGLREIENYRQGTQISAMGERVIYMRNALALITERPLAGYGTGAFATAYGRMVEGRSGREGIKIHDPHNQYLNIAAEHGLLGLAVFLALLVTAFRQRPAAPYRLLGLAVLAAWCTTSLFSSHFSTFAEGRFIWLWLGVCLARD